MIFRYLTITEAQLVVLSFLPLVHLPEATLGLQTDFTLTLLFWPWPYHQLLTLLGKLSSFP